MDTLSARTPSSGASSELGDAARINAPVAQQMAAGFGYGADTVRRAVAYPGALKQTSTTRR